jgi:hypothetical protein
MRVTVTTIPYEREHGHRPRGVGNWAFCPEQNYRASNYLDFVRWFNGSYSDAKREAVKHFSQQVGTNVIVVCS